MPTRSPTPCRQPGCAVLVSDRSGYCETHRKARRALDDARRGTAHARGYGRKWQAARAAYLAKHPRCELHQARGEVVAAREVDHIRPHRLREAIDSGDPARIATARRLFWDSANWQALCSSCHSEKTAREDGGWGRRPGGAEKSGGHG